MSQSQFTFIRVIDANNNPIDLPIPSDVTYSEHKVSKSDAGRDESLAMHVGLIGKCRKYKLVWQNVTPAEASMILKAFDDEYQYVVLHDVKENKLQKRYYYSGDTTAPFQIWSERRKLLNKIELDIIEADPSLASDYTVPSEVSSS